MRFLSLFTFIILFQFSHAQNIDLPTEYLQNNTSGKNSIPANVIGSPYFDDSWKFGTVYINETSFNRELRFNAFLDQIEMKEKGETTSLYKRDYISAKIGEQNYLIEQYTVNSEAVRQAYFIELNKGKARLLIRKQKELLAAQEAASSYQTDKPPRFIDKEAYFLKIDDKPAIEIKLKEKDILTLMNREDELKSFIKSNKMKLKTEDEVIQLLTYYNSL
jgi:hypothetical protein